MTDTTRPEPDSPEDLANRFTYHAPREGQPQLYQQLREEGHLLAQRIVESAPRSRERSLALTKVEEAIMWANAAIARAPE